MLQQLCTEARQVIFLDADGEIDGAFKCFREAMFKPEEIEHRFHPDRNIRRKVVFMPFKHLLKSLFDDLTTGHQIIASVGSKNMVLAIA